MYLARVTLFMLRLPMLMTTYLDLQRRFLRVRMEFEARQNVQRIVAARWHPAHLTYILRWTLLLDMPQAYQVQVRKGV